MAFTNKDKPTTDFENQEKPAGVSKAGLFGLGKFGAGRFGRTSTDPFIKQPKQPESYTKIEKP